MLGNGGALLQLRDRASRPPPSAGSADTTSLLLMEGGGPTETTDHDAGLVPLIQDRAVDQSSPGRAPPAEGRAGTRRTLRPEARRIRGPCGRSSSHSRLPGESV